MQVVAIVKGSSQCPRFEVTNFYCLPTVSGLYPTLVGPPQITPVVPPDNALASSTVHLLCTYNIKDPSPFQVGYKVTWYKIMHFVGGKPGKLILLTNMTEETAVVINFESAEFHFGDTVSTTLSCQSHTQTVNVAFSSTT